MQKEYAYDKKYLGQQKLSLLCILFFSYMLLRKWGFPTVPAILATAVLTVLAWYDLRRRERTTFVLHNEGIVRKYGNNEKRIRFDEITNISFLTAAPYLIRISITTEKGTFRLWRSFVNISDFLLDLKEALDIKGLSGRYSQKKFIRSILIATHHNQYQMTPGEVERTAAKVVVCMFINTAAFASYFVGVRQFEIGWWLAVAAVWPIMLPYIFKTLSFRRFVARSNPESLIFPEFNIDEERSLFNKVLIFGELFFFAITLAVIYICSEILNVF